MIGDEGIPIDEIEVVIPNLKCRYSGGTAVNRTIAPLIGKQSPDQHVWILTGPAPVFVASETSFFMGGPMWRMELADIEVPGR